jgi:formylglycine-generating enzyme required for sulfatase activity
MRKWMAAGSLVAVGATGIIGSCAEGFEPPATTAMVEVREGLEFTFGTDEWCFSENLSVSQRATCDGDAGVNVPIIWPTVKVKLEPFAIDIHEVTNHQYRYCVAMGACEGGDDRAHPNNAVSLEQFDYYDTAGDGRVDNDIFANYPVVRVTWEQARDYCAFVGKRLPTEFEWERVARGPDTINRKYPADGIDTLADCKGLSGLATFFCRSNNNLDAVMSSSVDVVTEPNGAKIYQMFGNAAEWTASSRADDVTCADDGPCQRVDQCPAGPSGDACREQSKNCDACPKDGNVPPRNIQSDECFFMCLSQPRETIVCKPYAAAAQPIPASQLREGSGNRIVRGGGASTREATSCQMSVSFRSRTLDPGLAEGDVGFRCAKSL